MTRSAKKAKALALARQMAIAYRQASTEFQTIRRRLETALWKIEDEAEEAGLLDFAGEISSKVDDPDEWDEFSDIMDTLRDGLALELDLSDDASEDLESKLESIVYEGYDPVATAETMEWLKKQQSRAIHRLKRAQARLDATGRNDDAIDS